MAQVDPQHAQFHGREMNVSDVVHSMGKLLRQLMFCVRGQNCMTVYVLCAWANRYDSLCSVFIITGVGELSW